MSNGDIEWTPKKYILPARMEGLLATLSTYYEKKKGELLRRIAVNATCSVDENFDYDNLDGGQTGHLVRLSIPAELFAEAIDRIDEIQSTFANDLNRFAECAHEHVSLVRLEQTAPAHIAGWREKTGVLLGPRSPTKDISDAEQRLWERGYLRVFLSHKSEYKVETAKLKSSLTDLGITAFVAHVDIEPTREWQSEIECALSTMDACVALLTDKFHDSNWTDQEVGVAFGRGVPIVAVRLGKDPYGFIGKFQGVAGASKTSNKVATELLRCFLTDERTSRRMSAALVLRFEYARDYAHANSLMEHIMEVVSLTPEWIDRLEAAPKKNSQLRDAHKVQANLAQVVGRLRGTTPP